MRTVCRMTIVVGAVGALLSCSGGTEPACATCDAQRPSIGVSPATVSFSAKLYDPPPPSQTVSITNTGAGTLTGLRIGTITYPPNTSPWLTVEGLTATIAPATLRLVPFSTAAGYGSWGAIVQIIADGASNSPFTLAVQLTLLQD
jgi:hypothetical protein